MRTIRCERPVRAGYIADYNAGLTAGIRGIQTNIDSKLLKMTTLVARHRIELSSKHLLRNVLIFWVVDALVTLQLPRIGM